VHERGQVVQGHVGPAVLVRVLGLGEQRLARRVAQAGQLRLDLAAQRRVGRDGQLVGLPRVVEELGAAAWSPQRSWPAASALAVLASMSRKTVCASSSP
jgi:hypothetical protein